MFYMGSLPCHLQDSPTTAAARLSSLSMRLAPPEYGRVAAAVGQRQNWRW